MMRLHFFLKLKQVDPGLKRLYQHLIKGKLDPVVLDKVGFIHDPNALTCKELFKLEDDIIEMFDDPE